MRGFLFGFASLALALAQEAPAPPPVVEKSPPPPPPVTATTTATPAVVPPVVPAVPVVPPVVPAVPVRSKEEIQAALNMELYACGDLPRVQAAIKAGADVNCRCHEHEALTALQACIGWTMVPEHMPVINALIAAKADVNIGDNRGRTAFWFACHSGNNELIKTLYPLTANHHQGDAYAQDCLHFASNQGHADSVKLLLSLGLDPTKSVDSRGGMTIHQPHSPLVREHFLPHLPVEHHAAIKAAAAEMKAARRMTTGDKAKAGEL